MTDRLKSTSSAELREELLSLVKSVKGQLANADHLYVDVAWKNTAPIRKESDTGAGKPKKTIDDLCREAAGCYLCPLSKTRKNVVFGDGDTRAEIVFVGEAPGADEDAMGLPFVGRAGQLLTNIIKAMGLAREDVYICNILKCRPPGNRNPLPDEIRLCEPYLKQQLQMISPRIICALGSFAAKTLLATETPITVLRGRFHQYAGIKLMPTYHPAYLLRNPSAKKQVWEDVQLIMKELNSGKDDQD
ncbi:MAG: uracil-DNA glycosylase [Deltaproteobacteria bacterium]|nr:uracil-DNA glycosylase [Deltaproteobacteria bacterium]